MSLQESLRALPTNSWRLRPTFRIELEESRNEALGKLVSEYETMAEDPLMFFHGEYGEFHLPQHCHRLWSPHLSFSVNEENGRGVIFGRFAPRQQIWTAVWVAYLASGVCCFYGLLIGYSEWMLGKPSSGFWIALLSVVVILSIYLSADIGQQWSSDQMKELREKFDGFLVRAGVARSS